MFKIILYTSNKKKHAKELLHLVDSKHYMYHMFFKKSMVLIDNRRLKNLRIAERDLSKVLAIDYTDESYLHKENCIILKPFKGYDAKDSNLKELLSYFQTRVNLEDEELDLRHLAKEFPKQ